MKLTIEFLYKNVLLGVIRVDDDSIKVNKVSDTCLHSIFNNEEITREELLSFISERCFSQERLDSKKILRDLGLVEYNQLDIVRKTHGVMWDDYYWFRFDNENLKWEDVQIR